MKLCSSSHLITLVVDPFLSQIQQWKVNTTIYILFIHRMLIQAIFNTKFIRSQMDNNNFAPEKKNTHTHTQNITRLPYLHDAFPNVMERQVPCPLQFANTLQSATPLQFVPANPG